MLLVSCNVKSHAMQSMYDQVSIIYIYIHTYVSRMHNMLQCMFYDMYAHGISRCMIYICICIYMYICIYMIICIYIYTYFCVYIYICIIIYIYMIIYPDISHILWNCLQAVSHSRSNLIECSFGVNPLDGLTGWRYWRVPWRRARWRSCSLQEHHLGIYPLVNKHSYWKWPFIVDFPIKKIWFSIVMLVYQRVDKVHWYDSFAFWRTPGVLCQTSLSFWILKMVLYFFTPHCASMVTTFATGDPGTDQDAHRLHCRCVAGQRNCAKQLLILYLCVYIYAYNMNMLCMCECALVSYYNVYTMYMCQSMLYRTCIYIIIHNYILVSLSLSIQIYAYVCVTVRIMRMFIHMFGESAQFG